MLSWTERPPARRHLWSRQGQYQIQNYATIKEVWVLVLRIFVFFFSCFTEFSLLDPGGRLEKTTRLSSHHVAQHRPTGSETTPPYAPRSSRFGSEPSSVEDDVDVWRYAILSCMPETTTRGRLGGCEGRLGVLQVIWGQWGWYIGWMCLRVLVPTHSWTKHNQTVVVVSWCLKILGTFDMFLSYSSLCGWTPLFSLPFDDFIYAVCCFLCKHHCCSDNTN